MNRSDYFWPKVSKVVAATLDFALEGGSSRKETVLGVAFPLVRITITKGTLFVLGWGFDPSAGTMFQLSVYETQRLRHSQAGKVEAAAEPVVNVEVPGTIAPNEPMRQG